MDKYEIEAFVQDIFKECKTTDNACKRYVYLKHKLDDAFREKLDLLVKAEKGGADNG